MLSLWLKMSALAPVTRSQLFFSETNGEAACGASVTASVANFDMNVRQHVFFDDWVTLRNTELFKELYLEVQRFVIRGKERQCLSYHTTSPCRAKKAPPAPIESLKACGMNKAIHKGPGVHVHVHLPHSFYDDDSWRFDYYSRPRFG